MPEDTAPQKGRPSIYTEEIAALLCERLAQGEGLRSACREDHMPHPSTVIGWVLQDREGFSKRYADAKEIAMHLMADEITDIADDTSHDTRAGPDGQELPNGEWMARSRLRVDTRKWLLSKLIPKKYGDKLDLNHGGQDNNPVKVEHSISPKGREALTKLLDGLEPEA